MAKATEKITVEAAPAEAKSTYVTKYTSEELAKAARSLFDCDPIIARAAFRLDGKKEYTIDEAKKVVKEFNKI